MSMNMEKGGITMNIMMMTLTSMTMTLNKFLSIETETKQQKKWVICRSELAKIPIS